MQTVIHQHTQLYLQWKEIKCFLDLSHNDHFDSDVLGTILGGQCIACRLSGVYLHIRLLLAFACVPQQPW